MDDNQPTVVGQPAINVSNDVEPVALPDQSLTLVDRVSRLEEEIQSN